MLQNFLEISHLLESGSFLDIVCKCIVMEKFIDSYIRLSYIIL